MDLPYLVECLLQSLNSGTMRVQLVKPKEAEAEGAEFRRFCECINHQGNTSSDLHTLGSELCSRLHGNIAGVRDHNAGCKKAIRCNALETTVRKHASHRHPKLKLLLTHTLEAIERRF